MSTAAASRPVSGYGRQSWEGTFAFIRTTLAVVSVILTIGVFPNSVDLLWEWWFRAEGIAKVESVPWNDASQAALESQLALSTSLFQTAIAVLAGMWGIVLVKRDEAAFILHDWQEKLMVCCATIALAFSTVGYIYFYTSSTNIALSAAADNMVPDLTAREVSFGLLSQILCIIAGVVMATGAIGSALWLHPSITKPANQNKTNHKS